MSLNLPGQGAVRVLSYDYKLGDRARRLAVRTLDYVEKRGFESPRVEQKNKKRKVLLSKRGPDVLHRARKMRTILNFTPHNINFFHADVVSFDPAIRKWVANDGASPIVTIPSSGVLNAKIDTVRGADLSGVPVFVKTVTGCDPLPDGGDPVIVSALFAVAAAKAGLDMNRVFTVADPVFTPDGRTILGCCGICPAI